MRKIVITGAAGMLGKALLQELSKYNSIGFTRVDCDITDTNIAFQKITDSKADIVIHTAALANVDRCELEPKLAHDVNAVGTENIARASKEIGATLFYISTDHVFDGTKSSPYIEKDFTNPINVYGKTKFGGETVVRNLIKKHVIIRTSWLFGNKDRGFLNTILKSIQKEKVLKIANDKFSTPTYVADLAKAISNIVDKIFNVSDIETEGLHGLYHITNEGQCSWFEYAAKILEFVNRNDVKLLPIKFEELKLPAKRPMYSVLDKSNFYARIGYKMRPWQDALKGYLIDAN